jgi:phospholipase C
MDKIEHVVLLMMENRSFDSMLGWLYEDKNPARNVPGLKDNERAFEGLQGLNPEKYVNVDSTGAIRSGPIRGAWGLNVPNTAPGESYEEVTTQLFGTEKPDTSSVPPMTGYLRDYTNLMRRHGYSDKDVARFADQVMQTHTPYQLPVLSGLAEHYAVCDMWFSSVPSQTNPNRAFAFCGTSMGMADNGFLEESPCAPLIESVVGYKLGDDRVHAWTIFNALHAAAGDTSWRIFRESGMLQNNIDTLAKIIQGVLPATHLVESLNYLRELSGPGVISDYSRRLFARLQEIPNLDSHFSPADNLDEFHSMARAGKLPNLSFIQPAWTIGERGTGNSLKGALFHQGDDYHPPVNLDSGEMLISQIYESLIANKATWDKTLLIITFDEPVGSFDHVPPPSAVPPWGRGNNPGFKLQHDFQFDRYGGRVPTILVSPLIDKSTVFRSGTDVPFDHTSLISTILKWRGASAQIANFGERTKHAPTFDNIVSRSTARTDARDIRFLNVAHKHGDPIRFYDRFQLRASNGRYVSRFEERSVLPFSLFSEDPSTSQYFPKLGYVDRYNNGRTTTFYCVQAYQRPSRSELRLDRGADFEIKIAAMEPGLGAYNVLGAWRDAPDCYYFNDYLAGDDNDKRQTWILTKADGSVGTVHFGDRVVLTNKWWKQVLVPDGDLITTVSGSPEARVWTVEPVPEPTPPPGCVFPNNPYYVKHANSGKYVTRVYKGAQWYPTVGEGERVKLIFVGDSLSPVFVDGMGAQLTSNNEDLDYSGSRCDMLLAWSDNEYAYYYKHGYDADYQTWILSVTDGSGYVQGGRRLRLINKGYRQFMAPKQDRGKLYLTTVKDYSDACDWVLEPA